MNSIDDLDRVLPASGCNIGVIAVPADAARPIARRLAGLGVRALLNFAPIALDLRAPVIVRNIDLAGEMSVLTHRLTLESAEAMSECPSSASVFRTTPLRSKSASGTLFRRRAWPKRWSRCATTRRSAKPRCCRRADGWKFTPSSTTTKPASRRSNRFSTNFRHGATGYDIESFLYTLLGRRSDRASLPRRNGARFDARRRSRDPRASQGRLRSSAAREVAGQIAAPALPRRAESRKERRARRRASARNRDRSRPPPSRLRKRGSAPSRARRSS